MQKVQLEMKYECKHILQDYQKQCFPQKAPKSMRYYGYSWFSSDTIPVDSLK